MKYRVEWTDAAIADLDSIIAYLLAHDQRAAVRMALKLHGRARSLAQFLRRGRRVGAGLRQSLVYPYQIRYRLRADMVEIVAIRHGARRS